MNASQNSLIIFHLLPSVCYILIALFIFALRGNKRTTNYMSAARFGVGVLLAVNIAQYYNTPYYMHTLWNPLHLLMILVIYPLFFAYIFSLMRPDKLKGSYWLATYLPLAVFILLDVIFHFSGSPLPPIVDYDQLQKFLHYPQLWVRFAATILCAVEMVVFIYWGLKLHRQHRINLLSDFSYTEGAGLKWVRWILWIMVLESMAILSAISFEGPLFKVITSLIFTVESSITTVFVLRQKDLYQHPTKKELALEGLTEAVVGTIDKNLPEQPLQKREILKQKLLHLLEKDEIFKDPELSGEKVREMLGTNRTYLSQVINQDLGTNFYNLVNRYRLKKAEEMLNNPLSRNMPLKNIAEICGFKSLSAFSNLFKQMYGKSPSDWREGK